MRLFIFDDTTVMQLKNNNYPKLAHGEEVLAVVHWFVHLWQEVQQEFLQPQFEVQQEFLRPQFEVLEWLGAHPE